MQCGAISAARSSYEMTVKNEREEQILRECGGRLAAITEKLLAEVKPGVSTLHLDGLAEALILSSGGIPVFKGYRSDRSEPLFPASICTSVNDEVVHAIPRADRILSDGDIIGIDIGMRYPRTGGLITDMAVTVPVGNVSAEAMRLIHATRQALVSGIAAAAAGVRMGDVGSSIQRAIESKGFGVVRELAGHGVGRELHEDPYVPNYGEPGQGARIKEGTVLALEPMAAAGSSEVRLDRDGWGWRTRDGSLAAHFEHTVIVTKKGAEILTQ